MVEIAKVGNFEVMNDAEKWQQKEVGRGNNNYYYILYTPLKYVYCICLLSLYSSLVYNGLKYTVYISFHYQ